MVKYIEVDQLKQCTVKTVENQDKCSHYKSRENITKIPRSDPLEANTAVNPVKTLP